MSPKRARRTVTIPGFPRLRGDEPPVLDAKSGDVVFSPPTRG